MNPRLTRRAVLGGGTAVVGAAALGAVGATMLDSDSLQTSSAAVLAPSGVAASSTAGARHILDPRAGVAQRITLSPPTTSSVYAANTVAMTVGPAPAPWALRLELAQDGAGGRYVTWHNVRWANGVVPALDPTPRRTTSVQLWSTDGRTVWGSGSPGAFQGVDPATVPGVATVWEAWPLADSPGQALTSVAARTGPALTTEGKPPELMSFAGNGQPLGAWERGRRALDFSGGGTAAGPARALAGQGWTLLMAFQSPGHDHDVSVASLYRSDLSASVSLEMTTQTPYIRSGTATFSDYNDLYQAVEGVIVVTLIQPPSGAPGVLRWAGHEVTPAAPWSQVGDFDTIRLNDLAPGPYRHVGAFRYGSVVFAGEALPYGAPSDPVPLIERWAAATLGLSI